MKIAHQAMTWYGWWKKKGVNASTDVLLAEVAQAGYAGVELGGDGRKHGPSGHLRELLAENHLEIAAWAVTITATIDPPNTDEYRRAMDFAAELGVRTVMACGGFLGEGGRRTTFDDDYKVFARNLRNAARYAEHNGQTVAFHPHRGCIVETAAETERLLAHDPGVALCPDTGHLLAVREDPIAFIRRFADKIALVHLKDFDGHKRDFAELGRGTVKQDFKGTLAALESIGYNGWLVAERDEPPMPALESATISREFLRTLGV
jgi:inosose dehydratase